MNLKAFTLVELIVVITILAVLGTIGFVSFNGYASHARDSKTMADVSNIHKKVELFKIESWFVPRPDNIINLESGAGNIISFQWEVAKNMKNILTLGQDMLDPKGNNYKYSTNQKLSEHSLLAFLESPQTRIIWSALANNNKYPYFKWDDVMVLLDEQNNYVSWDVQNLQIWEKAFFWKKELSTKNNTVVMENCKQILDTWVWKTNDYYQIEIQWNSIPVYCDMTTNGGGWTRVFYSDTEMFPYDVENNDILEMQDESVLGQNNFSILHSFADVKSGNKYEFYIKDSSWDYLHIKQNNRYKDSPENNDYEEISSQYNFYYSFEKSWPNHWLFLSKYWVTPWMTDNCVLSNASQWSTWTNCLRDNYHSYWTGPWHHQLGVGYSSGSQKWVAIYQR